MCRQWRRSFSLLALNTPNNEDFLSIFRAAGATANCPLSPGNVAIYAWARLQRPPGQASKSCCASIALTPPSPRLEVDGRVRCRATHCGCLACQSGAVCLFWGQLRWIRLRLVIMPCCRARLRDIRHHLSEFAKTVRLRINNADKLVIQTNGDIDIIPPGDLSFGAPDTADDQPVEPGIRDRRTNLHAVLPHRQQLCLVSRQWAQRQYVSSRHQWPHADAPGRQR